MTMKKERRLRLSFPTYFLITQVLYHPFLDFARGISQKFQQSFEEFVISLRFYAQPLPKILHPRFPVLFPCQHRSAAPFPSAFRQILYLCSLYSAFSKRPTSFQREQSFLKRHFSFCQRIFLRYPKFRLLFSGVLFILHNLFMHPVSILPVFCIFPKHKSQI